MNMKFPAALAVLMAMTGCAPVEPDAEEVTSTQKDTYKNLEDCLSDWGDKELCMAAQEAATAQANAQAAQNAQNGDNTTVIAPMIFYGPEYYGGQRTAYNAQGKAVFPKGNKAFKVSPPLKPSNAYLSRRQKAMDIVKSKSSNYTPSGKSSSFFSGSSGKSTSVFGGGRSFSGGG